MDAKEIQRLFRKSFSDEEEEGSSEEINLPPIQANVLPDFYDEKRK
jgi:hypothetical protein